MGKVKDLTGMRFGRLTVLYQNGWYYHPNGKRVALWHCRCDCGNECDKRGNCLSSGDTKSCGCLLKETGIVNLQDYAKRKYNRYDLSGEYGVGWTTNTNKEFYFDLEDYAKIKDYCWCESEYGYIISTTTKPLVFMHRIVMNISDSKIKIDHIKHNKTDNRKSQLRVVSNSQNSMNSVMHKNNSSGAKGVRWHQQNQCWEAYITINGKFKHIGDFAEDKFADAVNARKEAEEKYFGEFSYEKSQAM